MDKFVLKIHSIVAKGAGAGAKIGELNVICAVAKQARIAFKVQVTRPENAPPDSAALPAPLNFDVPSGPIGPELKLNLTAGACGIGSCFFGVGLAT